MTNSLYQISVVNRTPQDRALYMSVPGDSDSVQPNRRGIGETPLEVNTLKLLMQEGRAEGYGLSPHFLVKVFAVGENKPEIEQFLEDKGFYTVDDDTRKRRLSIASSQEFFDLLTEDEKEKLYRQENKKHLRELDEILTQENFTARDIRDIKKYCQYYTSLADIVDQYENEMESIDSFDQPPQWLRALRTEHRILNDSIQNNEYYVWKNYTTSKFIREESSRGTCIDIVWAEPDRLHKPEDTENMQGHWKLHISIDMERNDQDTIDAAYNVLLNAAQKYGINQLKVVAPFQNVGSMKERELTVYIKYQKPENAHQIQDFIREVEAGFADADVAPRTNRERANKNVDGGQYILYRNEFKKKFTSMEYPNTEKPQLTDDPPSLENAVVYCGNEAYVVLNGTWATDSSGELLVLDRDGSTVKELLEDDIYISAGVAERINPRSPHNPFELEDVFQLDGILSAASVSGSQPEPSLSSSSSSSGNQSLTDGKATKSGFGWEAIGGGAVAFLGAALAGFGVVKVIAVTALGAAVVGAAGSMVRRFSLNASAREASAEAQESPAVDPNLRHRITTSKRQREEREVEDRKRPALGQERRGSVPIPRRRADLTRLRRFSEIPQNAQPLQPPAVDPNLGRRIITSKRQREEREAEGRKRPTLWQGRMGSAPPPTRRVGLGAKAGPQSMGGATGGGPQPPPSDQADDTDIQDVVSLTIPCHSSEVQTLKTTLIKAGIPANKISVSASQSSSGNTHVLISQISEQESEQIERIVTSWREGAAIGVQGPTTSAGGGPAQPQQHHQRAAGVGRGGLLQAQQGQRQRTFTPLLQEQQHQPAKGQDRKKQLSETNDDKKEKGPGSGP